MKVGSIKEVLSGEAAETESFLGLGSKGGVIYVPRIIGIYQTSSEDLSSRDKIKQSLAEMQSNFITLLVNDCPDKADSRLIAIAYDSHLMPAGVLRESLEGYDVLQRIKRFDFREPPLFRSKPDVSIWTVLEHLNGAAEKPNKKESAIAIDNYLAYLDDVREEYGLTRSESVGLGLARRALGNIEGHKIISPGTDLIDAVKVTGQVMKDLIEKLRRERGF